MIKNLLLPKPVETQSVISDAAVQEKPLDGSLHSACSALMSLTDFQAEMERLNRWAQHGCTDGGCQIEKPKGMHTNGGCRCNPREFAEYLLWLACEVEKHGRYRRWPNNALSET